MAQINILAETFALAVILLLLMSSVHDRAAHNRLYYLMNLMLVFQLIFLTCCIMAWAVEGKPKYNTWNIIFSSLSLTLPFLISIVYIRYIRQTVVICGRKPRGSIWPIQLVCTAAILLNIVSLWNHMYFRCENGVYTIGKYYMLNQMFSLLIYLPCLFYLWRNRRIGIRTSLILASYGVLPTLASMTQWVLPDLDAIAIAMTLEMLGIYLSLYAKRAKQLADMEKELTESGIAVMFSQIQPHFLYNSLAVIQDLCHDKAPEAEQITVRFAELLRGNLDAVLLETPVLLPVELKHVQNYLELEKIRLHEEIRTTYQIDRNTFWIPALTLQLSAERILWALRQRRFARLTLQISTAEMDGCYLVMLAGDGSGQRAADAEQAEMAAEMLDGVRERLKNMCGGSLTMQEKETGEVGIRIILPKNTGQSALQEWTG